MARDELVICELCEINLDYCPHGNPSAKAAEAEVLEAVGVRRTRVPDDLIADGPTIVATQTSPCPGCGSLIRPDQTITHTEFGWAHTDEVTFEGPPSKPKTPTSIFDGIT